MLLRIIDRRKDEPDQSKIELVLKTNKQVDSFLIDSYDSPFSNSFKQTLQWYFKDYPFCTQATPDDQSTVENIIKFGKYLGDELLGEDHELNQFIERIEEHGYQHLQINIESTFTDFFDELWEFVILPESKYFLSTVSHGFIRCPLHNEKPKDYPSLEFNLAAPQPYIPELINKQPSKTHQNGDNETLNILHVIYQPEHQNHSSSHFAINSSFEMFCFEGAIDYEILPITKWDQFKAKLEDFNKPIHIVQVDSPVFSTQKKYYFGDIKNEVESLDSQAMIALLVKHSVALLCIDIREIHTKDDSSISTREFLTYAARQANHQGLGNIIGFAQKIDPWLSHRCLTELYRSIVKGFSLSQAVVETRKTLQSITEISLFSTQAIPFHYWSLLLHYGGQELTFFQRPGVITSLEQSQNRAKIQNKLLGFNSTLLPPHALNMSDTTTLTLIRHWQQSIRALAIIGVPGSGKTHYIHQLCLYLAQHNDIKFAFYFDYEQEFYTVDTILGMIAPILGVDIDNSENVYDVLRSQNCCFVFDSLLDQSLYTKVEQDNNTESTADDSLNTFIQRLLNSGQGIITTGIRADSSLNSFFTQQSILPLTETEQLSLMAAHLERNKLTGNKSPDHWQKLIKELHGNAFLIEKVSPLLRKHSVTELTGALKNNLSTVNNQRVDDAFFQWQWESLPLTEQSVLLLFGSVKGIIMEIIMIACDREEPHEATHSLLEALGDKTLSIAACLDKWEQVGFLRRLPHGRVIDSRAFRMLSNQAESAKFEHLKHEPLLHQFSATLCKGIRMLCQHVLSDNDSPMSNYLLINRREWKPHFDRLWIKSDYRTFLPAKRAFDQLLIQARLNNECAAWSLNILISPPVLQIDEQTSLDAKYAWVTVAIAAMTDPKIKDQKSIMQTLIYFKKWLEARGTENNNEEIALTQQVIVCLELFYKLQKDWEACMEVAQKALSLYHQKQAWQLIATTQASLATYSALSGNAEKSLQYEEEILSNIPNEKSYPGFEAQMLLNITTARLSRNCTNEARDVLTRLTDRSDTTHLSEQIEGLQAEIHYQDKNFQSALPFYCQQWGKIINTGDQQRIKTLKQHLQDFEKKLGQKEFDRIFNLETGGDITNPLC